MKDPLLGRIFLLIFSSLNNQIKIKVMKKMLIIKTIILAVGIGILTIIALSSCSTDRSICHKVRSEYGGYR